MAKKMTLTGTLLKWGNSYGIRVSKEDVRRFSLQEKQLLDIDIKPVENPLIALWNSDLKITREDIKEFRESTESKWGV